MALKRKVEKAIRKYPRQSRVIREEMAKLSEYEVRVYRKLTIRQAVLAG